MLQVYTRFFGNAKIIYVSGESNKESQACTAVIKLRQGLHIV